MTSHWAISFRRLLGFVCIAVVSCPSRPVAGGGRSHMVSGSVEITNSREPGVRHKDYSGVVIWLEPADRALPSLGPAKHAKMIQEDRHFKPHVVAISAGSTVDFP